MFDSVHSNHRTKDFKDSWCHDVSRQSTGLLQIRVPFSEFIDFPSKAQAVVSATRYERKCEGHTSVAFIFSLHLDNGSFLFCFQMVTKAMELFKFDGMGWSLAG